MPDNEERNPSSSLSDEEMQAIFNEMKSIDSDDAEPAGYEDVGFEMDSDANLDMNLDMDIGSFMESDEMAEIERKLAEFEDDVAKRRLSEAGGNISGGETGETNLDDEILKALEADEGLDLDADFSDNLDIDLINDVSVYDTMEHLEKAAESESGESGEKPKTPNPVIKILGSFKEKLNPLLSKANGVPAKRLYITTAILAVMVCGTVAAAVTMALRYEPPVDYKNIDIGLSKYSANDANFIYRNDIFKIGDKEYKLAKMLIDSASTILYYGGYFDLSVVDISVKDDKGREYPRDLGYVEPNIQDDINPSTVVRFLPFENDVKNFTVVIDDPQSGEVFDITYHFNEALRFAATRYVNKKIPELQEGEQSNIIIEKGMFTSSGSVIDLSLSWNNNKYKLWLGQEPENESIMLREGGSIVLPKPLSPTQYIFPNDRKLLIRADYDAIKSLDSMLELTLKNLFKLYEMNIEMPPGDLLNNKNENFQVYPLDNYRLNIERFIHTGKKAALVFHVKDTDIPKPETPSTDEKERLYYDRVLGEMDVELSVQTADGDIWKMKGQNRSAAIGCDVLFEFPIDKENPVAIMPDTFVLKINSVMVKQDDVVIPIDLKYDSTSYNSPSDEVVKGIIKNFFVMRLGYKAGEVKKSELTGFSNEILNDTKLMGNYTPVNDALETKAAEPGESDSSSDSNAQENIAFSVQVVTGSVANNDVNCIVKEVWYGSDSSEAFSATHKVKALADAESWVIVEDEIIEDEIIEDGELVTE